NLPQGLTVFPDHSRFRVARASRGLVVLAPWILAAILAACGLFFAWGANKGFDISDEAYYVFLSAQPQAFPTLTDAGFLWHPFYLLSGGNLIAFRALGLL